MSPTIEPQRRTDRTHQKKPDLGYRHTFVQAPMKWHLKF
jgi:hypothetical protein